MSDTEPTAAHDPSLAHEPDDQPSAAVAPTAQRTRLRDLVFGLRSLVAVAVAGVILGGLAGFALNAATGGDDRDGRMGRFGGPGAGFRGGPDGGPFPGGGIPGGPGQGPGQLPPQQAPTQAPTASPS